MKFIFLTVLLLAGCATTDLVPQIDLPHAPVELLLPSDPLQEIPADKPISAQDALQIINDNYAQCHYDEAKLKSLQEYISETTKMIDEFNKKMSGSHFSR